MKILAFMKYGDIAASTRQRLLQYEEIFKKSGISVEHSPLLDNKYLGQIMSGGKPNRTDVVRAYFDRALHLISKKQFDIVWVHYELFPYILGVAERLAFVKGRPIVYDFDDAIFHQYDAHANPLIRLLLGRKLQPLLRGSSLCVCGNGYLQSYAMQFCSHTAIVPTVVDTRVFIPTASSDTARMRVTLGWIGSPSTWTFVLPLVPLLQRLAEEMKLVIRVVGAGPQKLTSPEFEFMDWSEETEIEAIQGMDIGIMPLPDEPWARGKCGYKLIQYMACGIPVIASPVGVNSEIVDEGLNGFLAANEGEWEHAIRQLAASAELRHTMGARGREKIVSQYSLHVHGPRLAGLLHEVVSTANLR